MTPGARARRTALASLMVPLAGGLSACLDDCDGGIVSCPPPQFVVTVIVTARGTGRPVDNATIDVAGALVATIPCRVEGAATVCRVPGGFGAYEREIKAPGFQSERRTVIVGGDIGECGCPIAELQTLQVVMDPRP
jgi:hypothetical protein